MGIQLTVEDQPDLTIPEDFPVRAQLTEINPDEYTFTDKKTGEEKAVANLEWWFVVTADGKYNGRKLRGRTPHRITNNENNQTRQWAETLLGRELGVGAGLDTDDLIGLSCELTVRHEADRKNPKMKWERVDELLPLTSGYSDSEPPF